MLTVSKSFFEDEFNAILPFTEEFWLRIDSFDIEAGLLPQIKTSLVGSIDNIKDEAVERLMLEHQTNNLLVRVFNAILTFKKIHQRLEDSYISAWKSLVIDIKLGLPPNISCRFQ